MNMTSDYGEKRQLTGNDALKALMEAYERQHDDCNKLSVIIQQKEASLSALSHRVQENRKLLVSLDEVTHFN